jgi:signal transduction histidine kinase
MRLTALAWLVVDAAAALLLTGTTAVLIGHDHQFGLLPGSLCVLVFCAGVAVRRYLPVLASTAAGVAFAVPDFTHTAVAVNGNPSFVTCGTATVMYCYTLGARSPFSRSLIGLGAIEFGLTASVHPWNPLTVMLSVGPWLCGITIASRRRAGALLEVRARELDQEREVFARESVRYERARIARELHDIVAHCVSLMVVQANAGELLAATDPQAAAEAFGSISEAARNAEGEIARLVAMLADTTETDRSVGIRVVEELVATAQGSGVAISLQIAGDLDDLSKQRAEALYRIVQEGITNAMKHAPGAPIGIAVRAVGDEIELHVTNDRPLSLSSGLESSGGRHGLIGMRNRVADCGGALSAGPTPEGGWAIDVRLPRRVPLAIPVKNGGT